MRKLLLFSTFLFFFLFSTISFAYLPITINTTTNGLCPTTGGGNGVGSFWVVRNTTDNTTNLLKVCGGAGSTTMQSLRMYNSTLSYRGSCNMNNAIVYPTGTFIVNETKIKIFESGWGTHIWDFTNLTINSKCVDNGGDSHHPGATGSWYSIDNTYYLQYGGDAGIFNLSISKISDAYWLLGTSQYFTYPVFPHDYDNTTMYVINGTDSNMNFIKYVNGVQTAVIDNIYNLWGITGTTIYGSMWNETASTTWLFLHERSSGRMYKLNFTQAETLGNATTIIPSSEGIQNETVFVNDSQQLSVWLKALCNGTITWYLDGAALGTTAVTTAPMSTEQQFFYSTGLLASGSHYWQANFTDTCGGNVWNTDKIYFTMQATNAITTVAQSMANALGISLDNGKVFLGLLIAAVISGALAFYVKWQLFLPSMMVSIMALAFIGFFPTWMTVVMIVIAAAIFAKYSGLV